MSFHMPNPLPPGRVSVPKPTILGPLGWGPVVTIHCADFLVMHLQLDNQGFTALQRVLTVLLSVWHGCCNGGMLLGNIAS